VISAAAVFNARQLVTHLCDVAHARVSQVRTPRTRSRLLYRIQSPRDPLNRLAVTAVYNLALYARGRVVLPLFGGIEALRCLI